MEANVYQFDVVLPSGGLTLRLQRVVLDPADIVEMPPRAFSQALKSGGAGAFIRRDDNAITNPGTEAVDLYLSVWCRSRGTGHPPQWTRRARSSTGDGRWPHPGLLSAHEATDHGFRGTPDTGRDDVAGALSQRRKHRMSTHDAYPCFTPDGIGGPWNRWARTQRHRHRPLRHGAGRDTRDDDASDHRRLVSAERSE